MHPIVNLQKHYRAGQCARVGECPNAPANHDVYVCRRFPLLFNQFPAPRACSYFRGPCRNMQMAVKRLRFLTSSHWASGTAALAMFSFGVWYGYRVCTSESERACMASATLDIGMLTDTAKDNTRRATIEADRERV